MYFVMTHITFFNKILRKNKSNLNILLKFTTIYYQLRLCTEYTIDLNSNICIRANSEGINNIYFPDRTVITATNQLYCTTKICSLIYQKIYF
jgi:hypothetical protein